MRIKTVEFAFRKNLGNFQTQELRLGADIEPEENDEVVKLIAAVPNLLAAIEQLQEAFVHILDDTKGNKYRTGIIKHCENMRLALVNARYAVAKATN